MFKTLFFVFLLFGLSGCQERHYMKSRSRGLDHFHEKVKPFSILNEIERLKKEKPENQIKVLELGTGYGRVLIELRRKFPSIQLTGVNLKPNELFGKKEDYARTALHFGVFTKAELKNIQLPEVVFTNIDNGNVLPFKDGKFDLIFSQSTLQHIKHKFELLLEMHRIMAPEGVSMHTSWRNVVFNENGSRLQDEDFFQKMNKEGLMHLSTSGTSKNLLQKKIRAGQSQFTVKVELEETRQLEIHLEKTKPEDLAEKGIVYSLFSNHK